MFTRKVMNGGPQGIAGGGVGYVGSHRQIRHCSRTEGQGAEEQLRSRDKLIVIFDGDDGVFPAKFTFEFAPRRKL
jgi:hypothetical protein